MRRAPPVRVPTLAERALELRALAFPDTQLQWTPGRELRFTFSISPSALSRVYRCLLRLTPAFPPDMFVLQPHLPTLAAGRQIPHTYTHDGHETKLCLWLPRKNEWMPQMRLLETYITWTSEWLNYFEEWLLTDQWAGGGEHPAHKKKRWS